MGSTDGVPVQQISYDPGIVGFVKGHRHPSGAALIMTTMEVDDRDWISIFWVKRLSHNASPVSGDCFGIINERTILAADRCYDYQLSYGPPLEAQSDFQRQRVYDWEDRHVCEGTDAQMTWRGCQFFLRYVWERVGHGRRQPRLTNDRRFNTAISLGGLIHLPDEKIYWSKPVLLHEMAHELKPRDQHGPSFVGTYMRLAVRFLGLDPRELKETARRHGVLYR